MYLKYINLFRAIATLFVVTNHCVPALIWTDNFEMSRALKIVFSNGAFFFVFISGYLFQHLLYKYNYKSFMISRFKLVILPYLIVSLPAVIAWSFIFQKSGMGIEPGFYNQPWWYRVSFFYLSGKHLAPVWFIPMIAIFYVLSPLFKAFDRLPRAYWVLPGLIFLSYIVPRHWSPAISLVHFLSVYILGMAASRYKDIVVPRCYQYRYALILLFVVFVTMELLFTHYTQSYLNYLNKFALSFLFIGLLDHYKEHPFQLLSWFAALNFSVFFLHTYANAGIKVLWMGGPAQPIPVAGSLLTQFIYVSVVVAISLLITLGVKKILGKYSKYAIGA